MRLVKIRLQSLRLAFEHWKYTDSICTTSTERGSLQSITKRARRARSTVMLARPITRRVSPTPGTRKINDTRGSVMRLRRLSIAQRDRVRGAVELLQNREIGDAMVWVVAVHDTSSYCEGESTLVEVCLIHKIRDKCDKILCLVRPDGRVVMTRAAAAPEDDLMLEKFLSFLICDIERNPGRVRSLDARLAKRVRSLVEGVKVDLDAELAPGDE